MVVPNNLVHFFHRFLGSKYFQVDSWKFNWLETTNLVLYAYPGVSPIEWCPVFIPYRLVSYRVYRIPSIGLVYLPTWMVDFYGRLVGKYTNPISLSNVLCRGGIGYHPTSRLKSCEKRRGAETMTRETGELRNVLQKAERVGNNRKVYLDFVVSIIFCVFL